VWQEPGCVASVLTSQARHRQPHLLPQLLLPLLPPPPHPPQHHCTGIEHSRCVSLGIAKGASDKTFLRLEIREVSPSTHYHHARERERGSKVVLPHTVCMSLPALNPSRPRGPASMIPTKFLLSVLTQPPRPPQQAPLLGRPQGVGLLCSLLSCPLPLGPASGNQERSTQTRLVQAQ